MLIVDSFITFVDALSDDGIDYGTGYYVDQRYSDGGTDLYGPFQTEEQAQRIATIATF